MPLTQHAAAEMSDADLLGLLAVVKSTEQVRRELEGTADLDTGCHIQQPTTTEQPNDYFQPDYTPPISPLGTTLDVIEHLLVASMWSDDDAVVKTGPCYLELESFVRLVVQAHGDLIWGLMPAWRQMQVLEDSIHQFGRMSTYHLPGGCPMERAWHLLHAHLCVDDFIESTDQAIERHHGITDDFGGVSRHQ